MIYDTSPDPDSAWLKICRLASPSQRFEYCCALTDLAIDWSRDVLKHAHPNLSDEEIKLLWVEMFYGRKLADGLRDALTKRRLAKPDSPGQ